MGPDCKVLNIKGNYDKYLVKLLRKRLVCTLLVATHHSWCVPSWSTALGPQKAKNSDDLLGGNHYTISRTVGPDCKVLNIKENYDKFLGKLLRKRLVCTLLVATHHSWCVPSWSTARAPAPLPPYIVWDSSLSCAWCHRCNIGIPMLKSQCTIESAKSYISGSMGVFKFCCKLVYKSI